MYGYSDIIDKKRAVSLRPRMARGDRAKQFAPFAALRGFEETARGKERLLAAKPEVGEDRQAQLDRRIRALRKGEPVTLTYFRTVKVSGDTELGEFQALTGALLTVDPVNRNILLTTGRVPISAVLDVGMR